jgi:murein DD-endopeptidase MepM/ murein hydrolase activator NlpD
MYILHRKNLIILLLAAAAPAPAQFNTVLPVSNTVIQPDTIQTNGAQLTRSPETDRDTISTQLLNMRRCLALPIDTLIRTSGYGYRTDPFTGQRKFHKGIDFAANYNYVYAIMPGKIIKAGKEKGLGNFVEIEHGGFTSIYGHLSQILVNKKQIVEAGDPIGISGNSGHSTGEHLHFQMQYKRETIDPQIFLQLIQEIIKHSKNELSNEMKRLIDTQ